MKWTNNQFGDMEFDPEHLVTFLDGIIGFERSHKFIIVDDVDTEPFRWLVSVEDPSLTFPMLDPAIILPAYSAAAVAAGKEVWVFAALQKKVEQSTVNLRSPIVIDTASRSGVQVILDDETLPFQFPLVPAAEAAGGR